MSDLAPLTTPDLGPREPCPTPLVWQEVVQSFLDERREGELAFPGGRVRALQFGDGPPLVFLPGHVGSPLLFALTAWLLKDQRQCWLLDHPQFDRSPSSRNLFDETATCYRQVFEQTFPDAVDLYAACSSVPVALRLLAGEPGRLRRIILQGSWLRLQFNSFERSLLNVGSWLPMSMGRLPFWQKAQLQNHRPWFPPYDETRFTFLLRETSTNKVRDVTQRLLAVAAEGTTGRQLDLSRTTNECLILRCEGDGPQLEAQAEELQQRLPVARTTWMHSTGYFPYLTHPHRLVKELRDFLQIPKKV